MAALIDSRRTFGGKPLGEYQPEKDAFAKFRGAGPTNPEPIHEKVDWAKLNLDKVETLVISDPGIPIWEAFAKAKTEGKVIVPNFVHDRMLVETEHYKKDAIKKGYTAWTGTAIFYEAPDTPFSDKIVYEWKDNANNPYSISLKVPEKFRGKINCALVVEHPNFEIVPLGNNKFELRVADESNIHLIENIPKQDGWYKYDERFRIPVGEKIETNSPDKTMRYWYGVDGGAYGGLVARNFGWLRYVYACDRPSVGLGVHAIPLADAPKKE